MSQATQDPWGDIPRWSDGESEPAPVPAAPAAPFASPAAPAASADAAADVVVHAPPTCPWCATPAAEAASRCTSCGAALAQRESIGDLVVPGLTAVDPALKDLDGRPLHLRGPSASQGVASGLVVAAAAGGPIGLAILGGVGAVAAAEYMGAGGEQARGHEKVGETSEAVRQAIERLERGEVLPTASDATPRPELDATAPPSSAQSPDQNGNPGTVPGSGDKEATDGAG